MLSSVLRCTTGILRVLPNTLHRRNLVHTMTILPTHRSVSTDSRSKTFIGNEPVTYKKVRKEVDAKLVDLLNSPNRFQSINDREERSDVPIDSIKMYSKGRFYVTYRGCNLISSPEDYVLYHQLFWYVKPKTIIELGTCEGGSAVWFGDQLKLLDIPDGHVYTMDIDPSLLGEGAKKLNPDNVTFLEGDCNKIEETFTPEILSKLPHPWVVIDDAHINLVGVLSYLHQYLTEGDYIVVEDMNPYEPLEVGTMVTAFESCELAGTTKLNEFKDFLHKHNGYYAVDSFFTDFHGYNSSWMWHGFVRKMKN